MFRFLFSKFIFEKRIGADFIGTYFGIIDLNVFSAMNKQILIERHSKHACISF